MSTALDDANLVILIALEGATGPELRRQGGVSPGVERAVGLHDARAVGVLPAAGPLVDVLGALALLDAVGYLRALLDGEPERALLAPVVGVDEAGHDGGAAERRAVLPPLKGLVAEEPVPLAVVGVPDRQVVEDGVGGVLVLEAEDVVRALESGVADRLAAAGKRLLGEPLGVAVQGLLNANTERARDLVGRVGPDVLDVVAEAVVGSVTGGLLRVELSGLPGPGTTLNRAVNRCISTSTGLTDILTRY